MSVNVFEKCVFVKGLHGQYGFIWDQTFLYSLDQRFSNCDVLVVEVPPAGMSDGGKCLHNEITFQ